MDGVVRGTRGTHTARAENCDHVRVLATATDSTAQVRFGIRERERGEGKERAHPASEEE